MHVTCTRCAKSSESFDPPAWPEGWEGSVSEAVCPGCQYVEWHPLCEGIVDFGGRRVDRNGFEPRTVKTTSGPLELERPRLRNASELGFCSRILGKAVTRTRALEALVIGSFLRGLSVRDLEALLEETFGESVVSRSTASRICEQTRGRYRAWCARTLAEHDLVYCFLDAIYLKLRRDDEPAEGVLCAWGMTLEGRKVLLGLQLGSRESYEDWLDFARDLTARGLRCPALVVADGPRRPPSRGRARPSSGP